MLNYTTLLKLQMHIAVCFKMPYHDLRIVEKNCCRIFFTSARGFTIILWPTALNPRPMMTISDRPVNL